MSVMLRKTLLVLGALAVLIPAGSGTAQAFWGHRRVTTAYSLPSVPVAVGYAPAPVVVARPIVVGAPVIAAPAVAPVTTYYAPAATTAYYAPAAPVTTYYAPAAPVTTYYSPAAPIAAPVTTYYAPAAPVIVRRPVFLVP